MNLGALPAYRTAILNHGMKAQQMLGPSCLYVFVWLFVCLYVCICKESRSSASLSNCHSESWHESTTNAGSELCMCVYMHVCDESRSSANSSGCHCESWHESTINDGFFLCVYMCTYVCMYVCIRLSLSLSLSLFLSLPPSLFLPLSLFLSLPLSFSLSLSFSLNRNEPEQAFKFRRQNRQILGKLPLSILRPAPAKSWRVKNEPFIPA
jgi:hypothetical protein